MVILLKSILFLSYGILFFFYFLIAKLASSNFTKFETDSLREHNIYREKHAVPALKLNKTICNFAMEWAEQLAKEEKVYHRPDNKYGENVYWAYNAEVDGKTVVKAWYDEIVDYDFKKAEFSPNCGHFTQLIWKSSKEIGIALKTKGKTSWVVANYDPPGNYKGLFKENVLPLKEGTVKK